MGTRSRIGIETPQGITSIYCHWDGYPSNNGKILIDHYTTVSKINRLMKLGDLSALGAVIGKKIDFDSTSEQRGGQCLAYRRDRGEKDVGAQFHADLASYTKYADEQWAEYVYLFSSGQWHVAAVGDRPQWRPLSDVLTDEATTGYTIMTNT